MCKLVWVYLVGSESLRSDGTVDGIEGDTVGKTVVITLGAACAYILLVIVLMAWCRYRRRKKKQSYMEANTDNTNMDEGIVIAKNILAY